MISNFARKFNFLPGFGKELGLGPGTSRLVHNYNAQSLQQMTYNCKRHVIFDHPNNQEMLTTSKSRVNLETQHLQNSDKKTSKFSKTANIRFLYLCLFFFWYCNHFSEFFMNLSVLRPKRSDTLQLAWTESLSTWSLSIIASHSRHFNM